MKMFFFAILLFSTGVFAASLQSFHNRNFSPNDVNKCGWHVEVSGNFIVLDSVPNYIWETGYDTCWGSDSRMFECSGMSCIQSNEYFCKKTDKTVKDSVLLMADGNLFYQNSCTGRGFKNYRQY